MFDTRHDFSSRRIVASQLVRDDHARDVAQSFQKLAKEFLSCRLVSLGLDQNIQYVAIMIHCTPKVMESSVNFEEHFVEMPSGRQVEVTCDAVRWCKSDRT